MNQRKNNKPRTEPAAQNGSNKSKSTLENLKSLESWIWKAACSIRGAKDAPKYKDYILPLIFTKRLCDVFDDELNRIAVTASPPAPRPRKTTTTAISPSRYIHTGDAETYRPIAEIPVAELNAVEAEARETTPQSMETTMRGILKQLGTANPSK